MNLTQILIFVGAALFALLLLLVFIGLWVSTLRKPMGKGHGEDHKSGPADSHDKPHGGGFRLPSWILNTVAVILLVAAGTIGVLWIQAHGGISFIPTTTSASFAQGGCNGNINTVTLTTPPLTINPGGRCQIGFDVVSGVVRFGSDTSFVADVGPDDQIGDVSKTVTRVQAVVGTAELTYVLCPRTGRVVNFTCVQ